MYFDYSYYNTIKYNTTQLYWSAWGNYFGSNMNTVKHQTPHKYDISIIIIIIIIIIHPLTVRVVGAPQMIC